MESEAPQGKDITRLIGDEYVGRILTITHRNPMTTQDLSRVCGIPIAVAYRRVGNLERNGLLRCVAQVEVPRGRGKKVSYYQCAVRAMKVTFAEGEFHTELEFLPEEDMIKPTTPPNGRNATLGESRSACGPEKRNQPIGAKKPENGHGSGS